MKNRNTLTLILIALTMSSLNAAESTSISLPLWPDGVPNSLVTDNREVVTVREDGDHHYSKVTQPEIQVFTAGTREPSPAVVICPGGGYAILSYKKEGTKIAEYLQKNGIAGIVLKYRLPNKDFQPNPSIAPLQDAQRAMQMVREHAKEWNIDPDKVGVMGFSAGGHLASTTAHQWKEPVIEGVTPRQVRPDFSILGYPVISFANKDTVHAGSRRNLLGPNFTQQQCLKYSAEEQVDDQSPPAFLVHSFNDKSVPIQNSVDYAMALHRAGIVCETHFYQVGGHGYGMRPGHTDSWPALMIRWIRLNFVD